MSLNDLNPFARLFETQKYPHARTLRGSFLLKMIDGILLTNGHMLNYALKYDEDGKHKPDLFDYLTLGIFYALFVLKDVVDKWSANTAWKRTAQLIKSTMQKLESLHTLARSLFFIATLPLILIIAGIIQVVSERLRKNSYNDAMELNLINEKTNQTLKLSDLLNEVTELKTLILLAPDIPLKREMIQSFSTEIDNTSSPTVTLNYTTKVDLANDYTVNRKYKVSNVQNNTNALEGLYRLNIFGAAAAKEKLEQSDLALKIQTSC